MPNNFDRRHVLAAISAAATTALLPAAAQAEPVVGDVVLGDEGAPVTVIEYASYTCSHCADFHIDSWPKLKADYVDTGKVRYILREVYFDRFGLWASMVARCGGADAFYPLADQFIKTQKTWARAAGEQVGAEIQKIGRINRLTAGQLNSCLSDQDYAKALIEACQTNAAADEVKSTPTFLINGERVNGNRPDDVFALIDQNL